VPFPEIVLGESTLKMPPKAIGNNLAQAFDLSHFVSSIVTDSRKRSSIRFARLMVGRFHNATERYLTQHGSTAWVDKY